MHTTSLHRTTLAGDNQRGGAPVAHRRGRPSSHPAGSRRPPQGLPGRSVSSRPPARVADLFAGIGGFHLAFERAAAKVVFAAENDKHARLTYEANFRPRSPELFESDNFAGDVTALDPHQLPDFDVLTAGFPCQPFSMAGKRQGFKDARGTMFFEIARILAIKRPAAFFLENVQGLQSHDRGRTLATIRAILTEDLGYSFHCKVVRASDFGLPQLRPRLFMVGFRDPSTPFEWPEPVPLKFTLSDLLGGKANREVAYTALTSSRYKPLGTRGAWDAYLVDGKVHRLTVDEVRALQGFPEDFVFPVAMTHAYKQLGNAVAVPAVEAVARQVLASLEAPRRSCIAARPHTPELQGVVVKKATTAHTTTFENGTPAP
ncbi:MAG: DNA cytosine methyltransferase [Leucobacter sp.]